MIQVESLRRYPVPTVVLASGWMRYQFLIGLFSPFPFCASCRFFWRTDSSGIFQVTRHRSMYHAPWLNYPVREEISFGTVSRAPWVGYAQSYVAMPRPNLATPQTSLAVFYPLKNIVLDNGFRILYEVSFILLSIGWVVLLISFIVFLIGKICYSLVCCRLCRSLFSFCGGIALMYLTYRPNVLLPPVLGCIRSFVGNVCCWVFVF